MRGVIAAIVVAALAVVFAGYLRVSDTPGANAPPASVDRVGGDAASGADRSAIGTTAETAAAERVPAEPAAPNIATHLAAAPSPDGLPPAGLPLKATYAALLAAHRAGNAEASVRLRQELSECERYRFANLRMDMMLAFEDSARARGREERLQEMLSQTAGTVAALAENCTDLPEDYEQALLFEVQRAAAETGDLEGQLAFVLFPAMNQNRALTQMDRLEIYKARAGALIEAAMAQGSGQAVAAIMEAYEWRPEMWGGRAGRGTEMQQQTVMRLMEELGPLTPLQQALGKDPVKAYTYALVCQRACNADDQGRAGEAVQRIGAYLEPADRRRAESDARDLYDRHFEGRPRAPDVDLIALRESVRAFGPPQGRRGRGG
jgi:hypothetical protein